VNIWLAGARLRTLPAAVVPVAVGTAAARLAGPGDGGWFNYAPESGVVFDDTIWWRALAALVVSLAHGIRGTDDERRVGPARLVGSGQVEPGQVKRAAFAAFGVAGVFGAALAFAVGPELFVVGIASILAGWFYTGGSNPYGYLGLGEVFVFVFFGLVATVGSSYVQIERIDGLSVLCGVAVGFLACALLVINNLRDIPGDTEVGKRTLAVRMGDRRTRVFYTLLLLGAWAIAAVIAFRHPWAWITWAALPLAFLPIRTVHNGAVGKDLIAVLGATGRAQLVYGLLLTIALAL